MDITPFAFVLAVLATLGGAFAISTEDISEPARDWLRDRGFQWVPDGPDRISEEGGYYVPIPKRGYVRWVWSLVSCPYCIGFWCAGVATLVIAGWPDSWGWFLVWWAVWGAHLFTTGAIKLLRD